MNTKYPIKKFVDKINDISEIPEKISSGIIQTIEYFVNNFGNKNEVLTSFKPDPQKWSCKEILGHLIDSAANNHQRFVRAQYENSNSLISYEQVEWVKIEKYNERSWKELLLFWQSYNLHLAHILSKMPLQYLKLPFIIGSNEPVTLGYIITDYLGHMQHHIDQIEKKLT
ncbi:MAG: DinB family protein [Ignavibacteria bacterium]